MRVCRNHHTDHELVRHWLAHYKTYDDDGLLKSTKGYHFSVLCLRYDVSRFAIQSWMRKVRSGYRRITAEMHNRGYMINHKTVRHLMGMMNLKSKIRKVRYHSYKGDVGRIAPNIISRDFATDAHNRKWTTDVTQINIGSVQKGKLS